MKAAAVIVNIIRHASNSNNMMDSLEPVSCVCIKIWGVKP